MKQKLSFQRVKNFIIDYAIIIAGCFLYAVSMALFSSPNDIAPGGVIGISILINHLFPLVPIGVLSLVLNIPLFIWGGVEIGWKYLSRSLSATVISSIMIDSFELEFIANIIKPYTGNPLLVCIFGGILSGAGMSLIFNRGGSTGGTDIVSRIMHKKKPHVSLGKFMLLCDAFVVTASAIVYGNIENALYAIVFIFVTTKVIDTMVYGFARNNGKLLFVVTSHYEEVTEVILKEIDRGVTLLDAQGGYNKDNKKVILCAVRPNQVHQTTVLVHSIDPNAFVIVTTAGTISGEGFESDGLS
ncbi:MAG: YitT family protein [Clostridia bacterium]|nr:YitT family protein [Clostridia bacterium]